MLKIWPIPIPIQVLKQFNAAHEVSCNNRKPKIQNRSRGYRAWMITIHYEVIEILSDYQRSNQADVVDQQPILWNE